MLVVKLELWPHGNESAKRELGRATIINDGTGSHEVGNYSFDVKNEDGAFVRRGRVEGWPRLKHGAWALLFRCMQGLKIPSLGRSRR